MRLSIFGIGYVGAVSAACLAASGHRVIAVDVNDLKVRMLAEGRAPIAEAGLNDLIQQTVQAGRLSATQDARAALMDTDASIVCVGTPSLGSGNLDLSYVVRICEEIGAVLADKAEHHVVVIRSTMLPGSMAGIVVPALEKASGKVAGKDFGVAYFPEFLREGSAIRDFHEAEVTVFGVLGPQTEQVMTELLGPVKGQVFVTDFATAEAIKYTNNAWHAAKIVFANEIGTFCRANGIDSHAVMNIVCADRRLNISPTYMRPGFAYGGSCLPKDLRALLYRARSQDLSLPLLSSLAPSNAAHLHRAFELVQAAGHRRVGLIGLSFKGGTDDMRESPSVELAEMLFGKGYDLRIFDHYVTLSKLTGANLSYIQNRMPHLSDLLTNDLAAVVDFADTLVVATTDWGGQTFPGLRPGQVLVDVIHMPEAKRPTGGIYQNLC